MRTKREYQDLTPVYAVAGRLPHVHSPVLPVFSAFVVCVFWRTVYGTIRQRVDVPYLVAYQLCRRVGARRVCYHFIQTTGVFLRGARAMGVGPILETLVDP